MESLDLAGYSESFGPAARSAFSRMDELGAGGEPFLFVLDYDLIQPLVIPLSELTPEISVSVPGFARNVRPPVPRVERPTPTSFILERRPVSFERYAQAFAHVQNALRQGNSYLANLTFPCEVALAADLATIYRFSSAPYKLLLDDSVLVFSPEAFVRIRDNRLCTYPMKGTADATKPNARETLLADEKESAEHATVVDLLRNDIGRVSHAVCVPRYRYVESLHLQDRELYAVSSEIVGTLDPEWRNCIGSLFSALLPAGSVTGAPKKVTCEIIAEAERYRRGYYTGVFGVFDGESVESGVMIRYIEKDSGRFYFKSGGGITIYSDCRSEYEELIGKVDVPVS